MKQTAATVAQNLAQCLLALEVDANNSSNVHAALSVLEKLRLNLAKPLGAAGFQALLVRALALAKSEVEWLNDVEVKANGTLAGFDDNARSRAEEAVFGGAALLSELLALLIIFVGEALTLQLLHNIWSEIPWERNSNVEEIL